jgi:hypothetical protein
MLNRLGDNGIEFFVVLGSKQSRLLVQLWAYPDVEVLRREQFGVPKGIRTPVIAVKGRCPRPG